MSGLDTLPLERWQQTIGEGFAGTRALDDASLRGAVEGAVEAKPEAEPPKAGS